MKFYAVKQRYIRSSWDLDSSKLETTMRGFRYPKLCSFSVQAHVIPISETTTDRKQCSRLLDILSEYTNSANAAVQNSEKWKVQVEFGLSTSHGRGATFQGHVKLQNLFAGGYLEAIRNSGKTEATIQIKYLVAYNKTELSIPPQFEITSSELPISVSDSPICEGDLEILIPEDINLYSSGTVDLDGLLTITVTIPDDILDAIPMKTMGYIQTSKAKSVNQKILESKILSDVTLITDSGTRVEAHKVFLASQSPGFHAMFDTDMTEKQNRTVEIPEMTDEGVHALLRFLYYKDQPLKTRSFERILELYSAAHKYQVESLDKLLRNTMMEKPTSWFDLDGALKIFVLTQNAQPVDRDLQAKLIQVLKTLMKNLSDSQLQKDLMARYPTAALELCKLFLADNSDI